MGGKRQSLLHEADLIRATGYRIRYAPRGAARTLFITQDDEVLLAGPAGTGKSLASLHKMHLAMSKYPNAKGFMSRKTRSSMTNSCIDTYERHVLKPPDKVVFQTTDQQYNYPNGSLLAVIGLDNPERIKSTDWDMGFVQEVTECTENDWEICTTRLRNWVMPYQQIIADCNPDKPSHWIKKRCDQGLTLMLKSFHRDNPRLWNEMTQAWTPEGMQYIAKLQRLTGVRKKRLYEGEWIAAEGVIYEDWDPGTHMISLAELPGGWEEWVHYWTIDFGYTHPLCWQDWVEDPGTLALYRVREIYQTRTLVEDLARMVMELTGTVYQPRAIICDHDAEDRATFERHTGYLTLPAYKAIGQGVQATQTRMRPNWHEGKPGLFFVRDALVRKDPSLEAAGLPTCTEEEFDGYVWDEKVNRLVNSKKDELPLDKDNHGVDACFVAGTRITTSRGYRAIEDIRVGDQVLTRAGFRRVTDAQMTQRRAAVVSVLLSGGRELTGTGNHPIWADGGWKRLDTLRYADAILPEWSLPFWSLWSILLGLNGTDSTESSIGATPMQRGDQIASTFVRVLLTAVKALVPCILMCGSTTEGLFRLGVRSTIKTGIQGIIESVISSASRRSSIESFISPPPGSAGLLRGRKRRKRLVGACRRRLQTGIDLLKAVCGTVSTEKMWQRLVAPQHGIVMSVGNLIWRGIKGPAFAPTSVSLRLDVGVGWMTSSAFVPTVNVSSLAGSTRPHNSAPVHVVSVTKQAGLHSVYNLTVDGMPEYFANGILVHNCRYMVAFADSLADDPEDVEGVMIYDGMVSISPL